MRAILLVGLAIAALAPALEMPTALPPAAWRTETLQQGTFDFFPDMALKPDGTPVIVFPGGGLLRYGERTATGWDISLFATNAGGGSIDFDGAGNAWVAYMRLDSGSNQQLRVANNLGGAWSTQTVDTGLNAGNFRWMALANGLPHVLYSSSTSLKLATYDGLAWTIETVDSDALYSIAGLSVGSDGSTHIAYCDRAPGNPFGVGTYAIRSPAGAWTVQLIGSSSCRGIAIALDSHNRPHISLSSSVEHLEHWTFDGAAWTATIVDSDAPTGWDTSIVIDAADRPHISYWKLTRSSIIDPLRDHLFYAVRLDTGAWLTQVVDPEGVNGDFKSRVRIDADGFPHVAYEYSRGQLIQLSSVDIRYATPVVSVAAGLARPATGMLP